MEFLKSRYKKIEAKNKRILINTIWTFVVKAAALLISLFMLPAYMRFFDNPDILGLWFTALSILSWFLVFDLGVGNGLRNYLVIAFTEHNREDINKYISSAYIIFSVIVLIVSVTGYISFGYLDWNKILHVRVSLLPNDTLLLIIRILFIGIMLQFLLRLISSILMAMQKPAIPNFIALISNVFLLLFLLFLDSSTITDNLKKLSIVNVFTITIPLLVATVYVFRVKLNNFFPKVKYYSKEHANKIIKLGGAFFWIQLMYLVISNTNEFLINGLIGSKYVVDYKIYYSLFGFLGVLFSLALSSIWSEVTEALAKAEIKWIKRLYHKFFKLALFAAIGVTFLIFFIQFIVDIWLKENAIIINPIYSVIFALSTLVVIWTAIVSSFVNGIGKLKIQFYFLTIGAFLNIVLSVVLANVFKDWIVIVVANILSLLPYCIIQTIWLNRYFNIEFIKE